MKNYFFIIYITAALLMTGCSSKETETIKVQGTVEGEILTAKSLVSGTIEDCFLTEGKRVRKDDVLAVINTDKIQTQLQELDVSLKEIQIQGENLLQKKKLVESKQEYLKKQVERFRRLEEKNSISGEKLENMELKLLEADTARYEILKGLEELRVQVDKIAIKRSYLQLLLKDYTIVSPIDGIIIEKFISTGENIFPGAPLADILDESSLFLETFVEGKELSRIQRNQEVNIYVDGISKNLTGTVIAFGKQAEFSPKYIVSEKERQSLLYMVKIKVTQDSNIFKVGMPVTVIF
ncbi:MAG: HlyD family efflux transporter periplasmic adaptor subunit [Candidatus Aminicenantes bacterium]|nr:HlyD family efflux transporter periplasmic adaptor subunit [Candidatus Aminicenantes bacterium]